ARHLEPHFEVVKAVGDGQALLEQAARLEPDIVVLDISMPVLNGIDAARKLKAAGSLARIVFLTMHADPDYVRAALATGALGYVLKSRLASDLLSSMREALAGRPFVSPSIAL
ncbi:MAG: response regulator, partial [Candidatus Methylomirabilis sp.]